jgi:hypothetical protein
MNLTATAHPDPGVRVRFEHLDGVAWLEFGNLAIYVNRLPDPGQWLRDLAAVCLDSADALDEERAS